MNLALQLVPIVLAVLALIVAVMAYRLDRLSSSVHAISARTVMGPPTRRKIDGGWANGSRSARVTLTLVGPGRMLAVTPCAWGPEEWGGRIEFSGGGAKWEPGDPPIEFTIELEDGSAWPKDLKVGYFWASPRLFREGLLDHAQRFAVRPSGNDGGDDAIERWGRYRRCWRPVKTSKRFAWCHSTGWQDGIIASSPQV